MNDPNIPVNSVPSALPAVNKLKKLERSLEPKFYKVKKNNEAIKMRIDFNSTESLEKIT